MPDPNFLNGVALDAGELRRNMALVTMPAGAALSGRQGVRPGGGLDTSVASGTITVTPGACLVHGVSAATQGAYWWALDVSWTQSLTAAHATLGRKDLVYIRVRDSDSDSSGAKDASPVYLAGTASSTPAAPTPTAGTSYLPLAVITVPSVASGQSPSVDMSVRPYTVAAGGILPVANQTERDAIAGKYAGLTVFRIDTGTMERWGGSAWRDVVERHSVIVSKSGTFALNSGSYIPLVWDSAVATDASMWSSGQASRMVAPVAGLYSIPAGYNWPYGAVECRVAVYINGSQVWQGQSLATSPGAGVVETNRPYRLNAGDYVEIYLYHATGSTLTGLSGSAGYGALVWLTP